MSTEAAKAPPDEKSRKTWSVEEYERVGSWRRLKTHRRNPPEVRETVPFLFSVGSTRILGSR